MRRQATSEAPRRQHAGQGAPAEPGEVYQGAMAVASERILEFEPHATCAAGLPATRPLILQRGWACRVHTLPSGRRQIVGLLVPGDVLAYGDVVRAPVQGQVVSLTAVTVSAPHADRVSMDGALRRRLYEAAAQEQGWCCLHVVRLSCLPAYPRTAHLLLELEYRLAASGVTVAAGYEAPVVQDVLAEFLGLSVTHLNRTLQHLRRDGLIDLRRGRVRLLNRQALVEVGDFQPPDDQRDFNLLLGLAS